MQVGCILDETPVHRNSPQPPRRRQRATATRALLVGALLIGAPWVSVSFVSVGHAGPSPGGDAGHPPAIDGREQGKGVVAEVLPERAEDVGPEREDGDALDDRGVSEEPLLPVTRSVAPARLPPAQQRVTVAPAGQPAPTRREDVLERAPGLVVGQHGSEGKGPSFLWRGFDAEHGGSLEARWGIVPLNEGSNPHGHGYIDPGILIPESLRTLDVLEGSADLHQGPYALAGTLRFRPGVARAERGLLVRAEGGLPWRGRGVVRYAPEDGAAENMAVGEVVADRGFGENRGLVRSAAVLQQRLARTGAADVVAGAAGHATFFALPGQVPVAAVARGEIARDGTFSPDDHGRSALMLGQVERLAHDGRSAQGIWVRARHLVLVQNYTGFFAHPETGDGLRQGLDAVAVGGRMELRHPLVAPLELVGGAELQGEHLAIDERAPDGLRPPDRDARALLATGSGWGGLVWNAAPSLTLEAGARAEGFAATVDDRRIGDDTGDRAAGATAALSPRIRGRYTPAPRFSLAATWGHAVRPPQVLGLLADPADPTAGGVGYTGGWSGTVQADAQPVDALHASVGGFVHLVQHEMLFDHVSRRSIETSDTTRLGLQMHLHARLAGHAEATADAHLTSARTRDSGERLAGVPQQVARIGAGWAPPTGLRAGARGRFTGERAWGFGTAVGPTALLDLRAGWQARTVAVEVQMDNVLDSAWVSDAGVYPSRWDPEAPIDPVPRLHFSPGAPRTTMIVLTFTPGGRS